jgi:tetraacyldisaccharide 4'-kinase
VGAWVFWVESVIRGEKQGFFPSLYRLITYPLSQLFHLVLWVRHSLYKAGVFHSYSSPIPVVSIGNLSVGGTGKTALTSFFIDACSSFCKVAVLTRGYGRTKKKQTPFKVDVFNQKVEECGDEPWLLANRHPEALVIVSPNRLAGAHFAHQLGAQLILLDDGMQHLHLRRDLEVVVIRSEERHFLPMGTLRERPRRLNEADLIFSEEKVAKAPKTMVSFKRSCEGIYALPSLKKESLERKKVALISAIARPDRFAASVNEQGAEVISKLSFSDHSLLEEDRVDLFCQQAIAKGAELIVTTEKDRMKFSEKFLNKYPIVYLKQKVELVSNHAAFDSALQTIQQWITA